MAFLSRKTFRKLAWDFCSSLPPHPLIDRWIVSARYFFVHQRLPNLVNPQRHTEKIQRRKLYDRNPLLPVLQDKLAARAYVAARIGAEYLVPLYFTGTDAESLDFERLPQSFVIKPNHGCGWVILVEDKSGLDVEATRARLRAWLKTNYYLGSREWAYRDIPPRLMVEKFLHDDGQTSGAPTDYKILCFDGEPRIFNGVTGRHRGGDLFSLRYEIQGGALIPLTYSTLVAGKRFILKSLPPEQAIDPHSLDEVLTVCRQLSTGLDALRVDLYRSDGRLYFGEMTLYHGSGMFRYLPDHFDAQIGRFWNQPY